MFIEDREISSRFPPYIIAEISGNHNGDLATAMKLIDAAKDAGADAVKFQAYEPGTITLNCAKDDFIIKDGPWKGRLMWELYEKTHTPFRMFPSLFAYARLKNITPFASVFDKSSVDMLEALHCPAYKIASMEITDLPLIEHAALTRKPIILSTGMATEEEIQAALEKVSRKSDDGVALLHCISGYPTRIDQSNLRRLGDIKRWVNCRHGISDHTVGIEIPVAATVLGATIIEKHLMLGKELTEDYKFSMVPVQFAQMVRAVHDIWRAMQPPQGDPEQASRQLRRSLYVVADIKQGEPFTEENVRSIRPAYGLAPKELPWVLTRSAAIDLKRGTALRHDHIS